MNSNERRDRTRGVVDTGMARVVRGGADVVAEQGSVYASGISAETVGSTTLWLESSPCPRAGARQRTCVKDTSPRSTW